MAIGDDRAIIFSMSDGLIPCGRLSEVVPKEGQRLCSQIGAPHAQQQLVIIAFDEFDHGLVGFFGLCVARFNGGL